MRIFIYRNLLNHGPVTVYELSSLETGRTFLRFGIKENGERIDIPAALYQKM
jgi:hypothetical protein